MISFSSMFSCSCFFVKFERVEDIFTLLFQCCWYSNSRVHQIMHCSTISLLFLEEVIHCSILWINWNLEGNLPTFQKRFEDQRKYNKAVAFAFGALVFSRSSLLFMRVQTFITYWKNFPSQIPVCSMERKFLLRNSKWR